MTEWRALPGFVYYEISEFGEIRRCVTTRYHRAGRVLKVPIQKGYLRVSMWNGERSVNVTIHRAVCEAWHGPPPFAGAEAAHGDGNKLNNHYSNLRWATGAENAGDRDQHGRTARGERHGCAKLTAQQALEIRLSETGTQILSRRYGVSRTTVKRIRSGSIWKGLDVQGRTA